MFRRLTKFTWLLLLLVVALPTLAPLRAAAQAEAARVRITNFDAKAFPEMAARFLAIDADNNPVFSTAVGLQEDGRDVENIMAEVVSVGVDLIFVIDANEEIESRDEAGGLTRREKVRDAIIRFAQRYMDPVQKDRVSIIVPEGDGGRFLDNTNLTFNTEVINAINFYQPGEPGPTPVNDMLALALEHSAAEAESGRFRAIILFSDAAGLADQLDYPGLVEQAQQSQTAFYGAILGARADVVETENMALLTGPTLGRQVHMPQPEAVDLLYDTIRGFGEQTELRYRSAIDQSGEHTVTVLAGGAEASVVFSLDVQPAGVRLAVDNSRPIRRVAPSLDTALADMEPTRQVLVAEISWPDGHPRALSEATLLVNDQETALDTPVLDAEGRLTFEWDISGLDGGVYNLQLLVVDELGLESASEALPLTVEVQRPATPVPTAAPTSPPVEVAEPPQQTDDSLLLVGGAALVVVVLALFIGLWLLFRRRRSAGPAAPAPAAPGPVAPAQRPLPRAAAQEGEVLSTMVMPPSFAAGDTIGAYLEPLENASEYETQIPLTGKNVALGRDPRLVQIPFKDRSVSRLHARIIASHGAFRIYDEGSSSGTYVNYQRVSLAPAVLKDQDHIHLGRVHLRFRLTLGHLARQAAEAEDASGGGSGEETLDTDVYRPA